VSSKRRLYLGLKQNFLRLFTSQARWIKEMYGKESIFEKPYQSGDYRKMHLDIPRPDWGNIGPDPDLPDGGFLPRGPRIYIFEPGYCSFFIVSGICGETTSFTVQMSLIPYIAEGSIFQWGVTSDQPEYVRIASVEYTDPYMQSSIKVTLETDEQFNGTALITVTSQLIGSAVRKLTVYPEPFFFAPIDVSLASNLPYELANKVPMFQRENYVNPFYECGTVDFVVECASCDDIVPLAWAGISADIVARSASASVAVVDNEAGPFEWVVSGTGFTLDEATTTGVANQVSADASACGTATITVTDACGNIAVGYVRCTTGTWVFKDHVCSIPGVNTDGIGWDIGDFKGERIEGFEKIIQWYDGFVSTQVLKSLVSGDPCDYYHTGTSGDTLNEYCDSSAGCQSLSVCDAVTGCTQCITFTVRPDWTLGGTRCMWRDGVYSGNPLYWSRHCYCTNKSNYYDLRRYEWECV